jgi:hypothetical protein
MDYDFSCNVQMKEQETELGEDKRFVIRSRSLSLFQLTLSDVSEEQQARHLTHLLISSPECV